MSVYQSVYSQGGIFCFDLSKRQSYSKPSNWQGKIGKRDFTLKNFTIQNHHIVTAEG